MTPSESIYFVKLINAEGGIKVNLVRDEKGDLHNPSAPYLPEYLALPVLIKFWRIDRPQLGIVEARVKSIETAQSFLSRIMKEGYEGVHIP